MLLAAGARRQAPGLQRLSCSRLRAAPAGASDLSEWKGLDWDVTPQEALKAVEDLLLSTKAAHGILGNCPQTHKDALFFICATIRPGLMQGGFVRSPEDILDELLSQPRWRNGVMDPSTPRAEQMQMVSDLLRVCKHGSALVVLNRAACMPCFEGLAGAVRMGRSPTRQLSLMLQEVSVLTRVPLDKLGVEQQPNIFMAGAIRLHFTAGASTTVVDCSEGIQSIEVPMSAWNSAGIQFDTDVKTVIVVEDLDTLQNLAQHPELLKTVLFTAGERPNWTAQMAAMVLGQAAALEGIWVAALMHGNAGGWGLLDVYRRLVPGICWLGVRRSMLHHVWAGDLQDIDADGKEKRDGLIQKLDSLGTDWANAWAADMQTDKVCRIQALYNVCGGNVGFGPALLEYVENGAWTARQPAATELASWPQSEVLEAPTSLVAFFEGEVIDKAQPGGSRLDRG
ncbi:hypothetical protein COHA_004503 [Chlorella ohadii]|uniref:Uncharacterized protein n=1 Tax=Chlorella ohadii TaxID=2649997 RepID=A0AAD5DRV3_9CHLO|nr:hypothetical protein COHA_004503 [Chlorella ohadii]